MTGQWLAEAEASLRAARKDRFLRDFAQSTGRLSEAVAHLRQAVSEASTWNPAHRDALRNGLAALQRELLLAESSQMHAEGWLRQWMQAIESATGREAGYTRQGGVTATSEPVRIAVEG